MILLKWLDMWHTSIPWYWTFTSNNFMNLPHQFPKSFCTLWVLYSQLLNFLPPRFSFFAFLLFIGSSLGCVYQEPLTSKSNFLWPFITISQSQKLVVSVLLWSLIIVHQSKQQKIQCSGVRYFVDLRMQFGCGFDCRKIVGCVSSVQNVVGVRCTIVLRLVVAKSIQTLSSY